MPGAGPNLELVVRSLDPQRAELDRMVDSLEARILDGLSYDGREIAALPSFVHPPTPSIQGLATVLDIGGTNARAALLEVSLGGVARIVEGPVESTLPPADDDATVRGEEFFAFQADLIRSLAPPPALPCGYCFSYPARATPDRDMELVRWTKGVRVSGVVGTRVGAALHDALAARGLAPQRVTVVNDTVACLVGGAATLRAAEQARCVGLIVGTGTNMAAFFHSTLAPKLSAEGITAVNLESGNFNPGDLSPLDSELDAASDDPGHQRFEKAVSGRYLPALFALATRSHDSTLPVVDTGDLVARRDLAPASFGGAVAHALLRRSARLVACALAALSRVLPGDEPLRVFAEGGLFWGDRRFEAHVQSELARQLAGRDFTIERRDAINLVGAACSALLD